MASIKNKIKKELKGIVLIFTIIGLVIGLAVGYFYASSKAFDTESIKYQFELVGENYISLNLNDTYVEQGVIAKINDTSYVEYVVTSGTVNTKIVGTYVITYKLEQTPFNLSINRIVVVKDGE